jgi:three-Cys-motif partner protein
MAVGTGGTYWEQRNLPSVFKHDLIKRYIPPFAAMTGSKSGGRVVVLDGFAGRGRYEDGSPGSAQLIMEMGQHQHVSAGVHWNCTFVERDKEDAEHLATVVAEYSGRCVDALAYHGDVRDVLPATLQAATDAPLFLFLDPTGLGLGYDELVALLAVRTSPWPPTEFLLNLSLEAVRRIAGHVGSEKGSEATMRRLDAALGSNSWRGAFAGGVTSQSVEVIVSDLRVRLARDTGMNVVSVPVRRVPWHQPIYHLVFGTRSQHGLWVFSDSVARATQTWWAASEAVEKGTEDSTPSLFSATSAVQPEIESVEAEALPIISKSLQDLLTEQPRGFRVIDHTVRVFGPYFGRVREQVVRSAIKALHLQGVTSSDGKGAKPRDLQVLPPVDA